MKRKIFTLVLTAMLGLQAFGQTTGTAKVVGGAAVVPVTGVTLNPSSVMMAFADSALLTATVLPSNATNKNVTWSSGTGGIYFIRPGVIQAHVGGTATITVTTEDGGKTATCVVQVVNLPYYCFPEVSSSNQWISRVKIGSINNATSKSYGYGDYHYMSTDIARGSAQTINLVSGWATSSTSWKVWIDYNCDGDFTDNGEAVLNGSFTGYNINASFAVPSTATLGTTRMRVMMVNSGASEPCSLSDGEVEDYSVNITSATKKIIAEAPHTLSIQPDGMAQVSEPAVSVYPNPASDKLLVNSTGIGKVNLVSVTGINGKRFTANFDADNKSIDVSSLPKGMYIVVIDTEKGEYKSKFTKQ
jgi:bacillolysin